jgi:hypothetical protein
VVAPVRIPISLCDMPSFLRRPVIRSGASY